jgi:hypothetical protein
MSIGKINNIEIAYRNGTWYYGEKGGVILMTNNKHIVHMLFLSQGSLVPYDLLSPLERKGSYDSEWETMNSNYPLSKETSWYYGAKGWNGIIIKTNDLNIINTILYSNPTPYELLSPLDKKITFNSEWERMTNTYAL